MQFSTLDCNTVIKLINPPPLLLFTTLKVH